ncbi:hypothetical protein D3C71_1427960 [compost metagenome]
MRTSKPWSPEVSGAGAPKYSRWMWSCAQPKALALFTTWSMKPAGPHTYTRLSGPGAASTVVRSSFWSGAPASKWKWVRDAIGDAAISLANAVRSTERVQ